ncbi:efflux RND transporter permease subunit [Naasia aerilata]|uniref:Hydrogenase expression protein n=1 Tax=Naasia aerilata TaxID=1162966 RepID=A0ABN6XJY5_9MICO|nr:efflux RND transporter permease subunit [Naasia aerilata]BDZ45229.1 hydrogenase expression protein [Naasia aerilata]
MHLLAVASLKNRALIALVTIVAAVFGGIALTSLKQELIPSIQFPQLAVVTTYEGASPEVVNQSVSIPIEQAIQGVAGLESTSATSSSGRSVVTASFTYGVDLPSTENKIAQAVNRIRSALPSGLDPQVLSGSIDDFPVIQIAVTKGDADDVRRVVLPELEDLEGVRAASLTGAPGQRVTITPDPVALASRGLAGDAIRTAVQSSGVLVPAGTLTEDGRTLSVQAGAPLGSVADVASLPLVGARQASTIGDVATVALADDPVTTLSRVNGEPALTIAVTKLPAANTVEVSHAVRNALPDLEDALPGADYTVVFDQAPYIERSIESLSTEGLLGLGFAVLVILVFLLSVRATIVTAISIPTSVLITFVGLQFADYSLNLLTLGGLTIAIGRIVDDSIVVIENIKRHLTGIAPTGAERVRSIAGAVREVAGAVTASTLTTVTVFLPLAFVEGSTGELFRPFALTVTIALVASLVVSLTIVPVLAHWFLRSRPVHRHDRGHVVDAPTRLQRGYLPILRGTLAHPFITVLVALLVLGGTGALSLLLKTNFLGSSGQNTLTVTEAFELATSLDVQDAAAQRVEGELESIDGIRTVQASIGTSGNALRDAFLGGGGTQVTYSITTDADADQDALQTTVRSRLERLEDAGRFSVQASSGFGGSGNIEIDVTAGTQADLQTAGTAILEAVQGLPEVAEAGSNLEAGRPYVQVTVDRTAAAAAGYSEVALAGYVSAATLPSTIGRITIDDRLLSIYVSPQDAPSTRDGLAALTVPTPAGPVRLDSLATVESVEGPSTVTTVDNRRSATVSVTPKGDNLATANAAIQAALDDAKLPAGASAELGGVTADQRDAFSQLGIAVLVAILIVYIVMVATFRSLVQPVLLLVSIPFAATGALLLQVLTGIPLGVASFVGLLMLVGIVVTNAIVLIDLVNQYRDRGESVHDALIAGASRRLRPILMTALATVFALLPMAIGLTGGGGFISQPLALVVVGGLTSSTVLTLIVLPVLYSLLYRFQDWAGPLLRRFSAGVGRGMRRLLPKPKPRARGVRAAKEPTA